MSDSDTDINKSLLNLLSKERGLFGRIYTWGQRPTVYEYIGYELTVDFIPTLKGMSAIQKKNLFEIMNYFEIHSWPLKAIFEDIKSQQGFYKAYSEIAWSHFMTVVMFGMLEVAVKITKSAEYDKRGFLQKQKSIKSFLETYLPESIKEGVVKRYSIDKLFKSCNDTKSFSGVIDHLWHDIRSGFVHEAGIQFKGMEWYPMEGGIGTKEDPIKIGTDVPMQEWLQMTWQAILNSYGYKGLLEHPKYTK